MYLLRKMLLLEKKRHKNPLRLPQTASKYMKTVINKPERFPQSVFREKGQSKNTMKNHFKR